MFALLLGGIACFDYSKFFSYNKGETENIAEFYIPNFDSNDWKFNQFEERGQEKLGPTSVKVPGIGGWTPWNGVSISVTLAIENNYSRVELSCPAADGYSPLSNAWCYVDIWNGTGTALKWGVLAKQGETAIVQLDNGAVEGDTIKATFYLYNDDTTTDAFFGIPGLKFFQKKYNYLADVESEPVDGHSSVTRKTVSISRDAGKIDLQTLVLLNQWQLPNPVQYNMGGLNYYDSGEPFATVPIIANATHIIGFDIFHDTFIQPWRIVEETDGMDRTSALSLHMVARTDKGASMTYLVWETESTSWTDALEKWHIEFSEIYQEAPAGWGLWAPFAHLEGLFPNNTDYRDVYHVGFTWGSSPEKCKKDMDNYVYTEPTYVHINTMKFNENTWLSDIEACANNEEHPERDACKAALACPAKQADGSWMIIAEHEPWNPDGIRLVTIYDGICKDYLKKKYHDKLNDIYYPGIYCGGSMDSFATGATEHYMSLDDTETINHVPYLMYDQNGATFLPIYASLSTAFHDLAVHSPQGVLLNAFSIPPEFVRLQGNLGYEIQTASAEGFDYNEWTQALLWKARYNGCAHSQSYIENTDRTYGKKYTEEYFSVMASIGSVASYFSHNAAENNFWDPESNDIFELRDVFERWMEPMNEACNGSWYYANQLGLVKMTMDESRQVPDLDEKHDISSVSMFCKPEAKAVDGAVDCYVMAFLGYRNSHSAGNTFMRVAEIDINGANPECFFTAKDMKCTVDSNGKVTVSMAGIESGKTYRTAIIKFKRSVEQNAPETQTPGTQTPTEPSNSNVGVIVGSVVGSIAAVALIAVGAVFVIRKHRSPVDAEMKVAV